MIDDKKNKGYVGDDRQATKNERQTTDDKGQTKKRQKTEDCRQITYDKR